MARRTAVAKHTPRLLHHAPPPRIQSRLRSATPGQDAGGTPSVFALRATTDTPGLATALQAYGIITPIGGNFPRSTLAKVRMLAYALPMTGEQMVAWMEQWRSASQALEEVRAQELAVMTEEDRATAARAVMDLPTGDRPQRDVAGQATSGLVIQQQIFAKAHRP